MPAICSDGGKLRAGCDIQSPQKRQGRSRHEETTSVANVARTLLIDLRSVEGGRCIPDFGRAVNARQCLVRSRRILAVQAKRGSMAGLIRVDSEGNRNRGPMGMRIVVCCPGSLASRSSQKESRSAEYLRSRASAHMSGIAIALRRRIAGNDQRISLDPVRLAARIGYCAATALAAQTTASMNRRIHDDMNGASSAGSDND